MSRYVGNVRLLSIVVNIKASRIANSYVSYYFRYDRKSNDEKWRIVGTVGIAGSAEDFRALFLSTFVLAPYNKICGKIKLELNFHNFFWPCIHTVRFQPLLHIQL